jgi:V/A-type H+-transporting ATPase subunit D
MSVRSVPPTRSGLVRASAQLGRVQKGRELLNRKREALITELFKSARPALNARQEVEERAGEAYRALLRALAARGQASLETYAWPGREIAVELEHKQIWGIAVPSVVSHSPIQRTLTARETAAPSVGPAAAQTATEFERLVELVLDALPKEQLVRRLGDALAKATRQVNTLQLRVEPALTAELSALRRMLEERERDERSRLRHVLRRRKNAR